MLIDQAKEVKTGAQRNSLRARSCYNRKLNLRQKLPSPFKYLASSKEHPLVVCDMFGDARPLGQGDKLCPFGFLGEGGGLGEVLAVKF